MLFMSCNWRLIISQTEREVILKNNLGCSPRQWSELSGRVSGKRNCQWFKKTYCSMIFRFFKCRIYDTALKQYSDLQPRSTSLLLRRSRRDFPHWMSPDLTDITGPCTVSKHSLGFQDPQLLNNPCSKLPLHSTNTEGHCRNLFINTIRASLGLDQSSSATRTCSLQYPCLGKACESITGLAASKLSFLSSPLLWNGNEIPEKFSMKPGAEENEAICKQRWIRKHFLSWHLPKPLILALESSPATQESRMEEKALAGVQKSIIPTHPCLLLVPILV